MENDHPLERLRLVSQRFAELQGLRVALAGSVFTLVFGTYLMVRPAQGRGGVWIALAIAFALMLPGERVIRRYYARTFGRVSPNDSHSAFVRAGAIGVGLVVLDVFGVPLPASVFLISAAGALWTGFRDWPFRGYHLGAAAACLCAFPLQTIPEAGIEPDLAAAAGFLVIGIVYVPIGFLDHRLLVSAMRLQAGRIRDANAIDP